MDRGEGEAEAEGRREARHTPPPGLATLATGLCGARCPRAKPGSCGVEDAAPRTAPSGRDNGLLLLPLLDEWHPRVTHPAGMSG